MSRAVGGKIDYCCENIDGTRIVQNDKTNDVYIWR